MRDLQLDSAGNIQLTDGDLACRTGDDGIAQLVQIRLQTFKGEPFLAPTEGVDYYEKILIKSAKESVVRRELERVAEETPGGLVRSATVTRYEISDDQQTLEIDMEIMTINNTQITVNI